MMTCNHSTAPACIPGGEKEAARDWTVTWPINPLALSALHGVGMSDNEIADYYRVSPREVVELRATYCIR